MSLFEEQDEGSPSQVAQCVFHPRGRETPYLDLNTLEEIHS